MRYITLSVLLVISMFIIGCNSSDAPVETPKEEQKVTETKTETKVNVDKSSSEFLSMLSKKSSLEWQITYDIKMNAMGNEMKSTMIQYIKGTNKVRTDMSTQGMESRAYVVDGVVTSCSKVSSKWNCFKVDAPKDGMADMEKNIQSNIVDYNIAEDGTKSILNMQAKCYKIEGKDMEYTSRYCYTAEGVPLYVYYKTDQVTSEMTALLYEKTVKDSAFVPPAEATEMTMPAQGEGMGKNPCDACDYLSGETKDQCLASC